MDDVQNAAEEDTVAHLDTVTRRLFVGPVPTNFTNVRKQKWNRRFQYYTSRRITYDAVGQAVPPTDARVIDTLFNNLRIITTSQSRDVRSAFQNRSDLSVNVSLGGLSHTGPAAKHAREAANGGASNGDAPVAAAANTAAVHAPDVLSVPPNPLLPPVPPASSVTPAITARTSLDVGAPLGHARSNSKTSSTGSASMCTALTGGTSVPENLNDAKSVRASTSTYCSSEETSTASAPRAAATPARQYSHRKQPSTAQSWLSHLGLQRTVTPVVFGSSCRSLSSFTESSVVLRKEHALVRVDTTASYIQPDFNDFAYSNIPTKTVQPWCEFWIIARKCTTSGVVRLDFVPENDRIKKRTRKVSRRLASELGDSGNGLDDGLDEYSFDHHNNEGELDLCKYSLYLCPETTSWNVFSSLDHSIAIWSRKRNEKTVLFLLRFRRLVSAFEWVYIVSSALSFHSPGAFTLGVPAFHLHMRIIFPALHERDKVESGTEDSAEQPIVRKPNPNQIHKIFECWNLSESEFVSRCLHVLRKNTEWSQIIKRWSQSSNLGLCWRTYDRVDWIPRLDDLTYVGLMVACGTHELELRPKLHYPTHVRTSTGEFLEEPEPIEGYLIRLTSSTGREMRLGQMFCKKLYAAVFNCFLFFVSPDLAIPPFVTAENLLYPDYSFESKTDYFFHFTAFPYKNRRGNTQTHEKEKALLAAERVRVRDLLCFSTGLVDLRKVTSIEPRDANGQSNQFVIITDMGMRLEFKSFCKETRDAWVTRLNQIAHYWRERKINDFHELNEVRDKNISILHIDHSTEPHVASYCSAWEVSECVASPLIHNYCSVLGCRSIQMHGHLFYRQGAVFQKYFAILIPGHIILYQNAERTQSGKLREKTYYHKCFSIPLTSSYIYSGFITDNMLLKHKHGCDLQTHALPRIFKDGWRTVDRDEMLAFVIWSNNSGVKRFTDEFEHVVPKKVNCNKEKNQFAKSFVFLSRSRQERDVWVKRIEAEIDRCDLNSVEPQF